LSICDQYPKPPLIDGRPSSSAESLLSSVGGAKENIGTEDPADADAGTAAGAALVVGSTPSCPSEFFSAAASILLKASPRLLSTT
jgi:hypothetical protein